MDRNHLWGELRSHLQLLDGCADLSTLHQGSTQVVMRFGHEELQPDSLAEVVNRFVESAFASKK